MAVKRPAPTDADARVDPEHPEYSERSDGPTPNGGAYAIAYFADARGNPCVKADARSMEIVEYDADGEAVHRTYMHKSTDTGAPLP